MGRPFSLIKKSREEEIGNPSSNLAFSQVLDTRLSRRRFLTAPNGSEVTGIAFTPDNKTMFVNIQHPGEPRKGNSNPADPKAVSSWPDGAAGGRPRAATVIITKDDGGVIGS